MKQTMSPAPFEGREQSLAICQWEHKKSAASSAAKQKKENTMQNCIIKNRINARVSDAPQFARSSIKQQEGRKLRRRTADHIREELAMDEALPLVWAGDCVTEEVVA